MVKPAVQETQFDPWVGKINWRRKWQPTPVLLPGKSYGWRSLVGYSLCGRKESDTTEWLHFYVYVMCVCVCVCVMYIHIYVFLPSLASLPVSSHPSRSAQSPRPGVPAGISVLLSQIREWKDKPDWEIRFQNQIHDRELVSRIHQELSKLS